MDDKIMSVHMRMHQSVYTALEELAHAKDMSIGDALRDAVALSLWVKRTMDSGKKVLTEQDGDFRQLVRY